MYYLGVDGGGTKTKYILIDKELNIIKDIERGTIHIHQIGEEKLKDELLQSINIILSETNINRSDIGYVFLGVPGYGESESDKRIIDKILCEVLYGIKYEASNDSVVGWAAGTGCKDGINIVAGTGSIAYGRNENGDEDRVGGWGPGIGDDGSAYWIALKVINEYTKQKDGRREKTVLLDIMEEELNIKDYFEIVDIVFNKMKFSRTEIASFSKIGAMAAEKGCRVCKFIFEEAAYNLYLHIKVLAKKLEFNNEFIVSYSGGVFNSGNLILDPLVDMIKEDGLNCVVKKPEIEPCHGAALLAYKLYGNDIPNNYKEKLKS